MVKKVGFIDYYLDEWHANHYPEWLKEYSDGRYEVTYAYGEIDSPLGGISNEEWAKKNGVTLCQTIDEVVEKSDVLIVLSPDNPEQHEHLCEKPLMSGKLTYVDKTFAPDADTARRIFKIAEKGGTKLFSTSALRYATEIQEMKKGEAIYVSSIGPGVEENYFIHQFEPIVYLMGPDVKRIMYTGSINSMSFTLEFSDGRRAYMNMPRTWGAPQMLAVKYNDSFVMQKLESDSFRNFMHAMVKFFDDGEVPVDPQETITLMAIIGAASEAIKKPDEWINL